MAIISNIKNRIKKNRYVFSVFSPMKKIYNYIFLFYRRNKRFKEKGEQVLLKAKYALESINLHFWVDFGTLLGIYRDNALLPNDLDIDLGVFLKDYSPKIEEAMRKFGFTLLKEYVIDEKKYGLEQTYELNGVTVDLFFYSHNDKQMWSHLFVNFPGMSYKESLLKNGGLLPIEQYFLKTGFASIQFLNVTFTIPDAVHNYLAFHYGKYYKSPRKWNYADLENDNKNAKYLTNKIGIVI